MARGRELRRFQCRSDDDGSIYTVIEYEMPGPTFTPVATGGTQPLRGRTELSLSDGEPVDYIAGEDRLFRIVATGAIIRMI